MTQNCTTLRILDALGVLDDIRARTEETSQNADPGQQHHEIHKTSGWFKFLSGLEGHKLILDVRNTRRMPTSTRSHDSLLIVRLVGGN